MPVKEKLIIEPDGEIAQVPVHAQGQAAFTAKRNPETGEIEAVPTANLANHELTILAQSIDLASTGLGISRDVYTDTFSYRSFRYRLRYVGRDVLLANDAYLKYTIKELGLEELAETFQDFSSLPDPEGARMQAAIALFASGGFRVDHPDLSTRADELVAQRYEQILIGTDPEGNNPSKWGGLVGWTIDNVAPDKFPFSLANVRRLNLQTKAVLYNRVLSLTREGVTDAQFRQSTGL